MKRIFSTRWPKATYSSTPLYSHRHISLIHLHTHIDCVITTPPLLYLHSLAAENFGCPHLNHSDQLHTMFFLLTHSPFPESRLDDSCCLLLPCFQFMRLMLLSQVMHTLQKGSESPLWNNHKTTIWPLLHVAERPTFLDKALFWDGYFLKGLAA